MGESEHLAHGGEVLVWDVKEAETKELWHASCVHANKHAGPCALARLLVSLHPMPSSPTSLPVCHLTRQKPTPEKVPRDDTHESLAEPLKLCVRKNVSASSSVSGTVWARSLACACACARASMRAWARASVMAGAWVSVIGVGVCDRRGRAHHEEWRRAEELRAGEDERPRAGALARRRG
eukprot:1729442-Pleurochrysis_carterae.AAC.4